MSHYLRWKEKFLQNRTEINKAFPVVVEFEKLLLEHFEKQEPELLPFFKTFRVAKPIIGYANWLRLKFHSDIESAKANSHNHVLVKNFIEEIKSYFILELPSNTEKLDAVHG